MPWISVKEKLPDKNGAYLVYIWNKYTGCIDICRFAVHYNEVDQIVFANQTEGGFYSYDREYGFYKLSCVTHWMPLPETPTMD